MARTVVSRTLAATRPIRVRRPRVPIGNSPPFISNITATSFDSTTEDISWSLDQYATGYVQYGATTAYGLENVHEDSFNYNQHIQRISGLAPGTLYHFRVRSTNAYGQETISGDGTFTTAGASTGPAISNVVVSNITATGANVAWDTNIPSTGYVEYGLTTAYGSQSATDSVLSTHHNLACTPLAAPSTVYHYKIHTFDNLGNPATSTDATFTTAATNPYGVRPAPADLASFVYMPSASWAPTTGQIATVPVIDATTGCTEANFNSWWTGILPGTINNPRIVVWPAGRTWTRNTCIEMDGHAYTIHWGYPAAGLTTGHAKIHNTSTGGYHNQNQTVGSMFRANFGPNAHHWKVLGMELEGINAWAGTIHAFGADLVSGDSANNTLGTGEGSHGIMVANADHVEVADVWMHHLYGAHIAVYSGSGYGTGTGNNKFINIHHNLLEKDGEQSITVSGAEDVWVQFNLQRDLCFSILDHEDIPGTISHLYRIHYEDNLVDGWFWGKYPYYEQYGIVHGHSVSQAGPVDGYYILRNTFLRGPMGWGRDPANPNPGYTGAVVIGRFDPAGNAFSSPAKANVHLDNNDFSSIPSAYRVGTRAFTLSNCTTGSITGNNMPGMTIVQSNNSGINTTNPPNIP